MIELGIKKPQNCSMKTHFAFRANASDTGPPGVNRTSFAADVLYGGTAAGMQRQALHAYRLALDHPVTHQSLVFQACLPQDFSDALSHWGLSYNLS
jgi:hypothetical protein